MEHLSPEAIKVLGICTIFLFAGLGAMIYALLDHQRKMAKILNSDRKQADGLDERVDALQSQIRDLQVLIISQSDALAKREDLQHRISESSKSNV